MPEEPKFTVTFTGPQLDFIGKFAVDTLNAANAQAKMASEVYQLLRASVQPKPHTNGLSVVPAAEAVVAAESPAG